MTLTELITAVRGRVNDSTAPYLCSDDLFTIFANDAENEACRRARLILDATTGQVCTLAIIANQVNYTLEPCVLFIRRAKWTATGDGSTTILLPVSSRDLDRADSNWDTQTGRPRAFVIDSTEGMFRPWPTPDVAGTVNLTVVRTPIVPMENGIDEPEIAPRFHAALEHWMRKRYYEMLDKETYDPKRAAEAEADFEREFGKKSSAIDETWLQREGNLFTDEGNY